MAAALGGADPTGALSRTHAEIEHQTIRLRHLLDGAGSTAESVDVLELRRLLYGLHAILRLHNAQEEEGAFSLVPYETTREELQKAARGGAFSAGTLD